MSRLQRRGTSAEFARDPFGGWVPAERGLVWCRSASLCGVVVWDRPNPAQTRELLGIMESHGHPGMAPRFDLVLDASRVTGLEPDSVVLLVEWSRAHADIARDRIRRRITVLPAGMDGLIIAGIRPALELDGPETLVTDAVEGFRAIDPDGGEALAVELARLASEVRDVPEVLHALRRALAETHGAIGLADAAARLGVSTRSLQRQLGAAGISFRGEQAEARYRAAESLLRGDDKLATVAARVGLSEDGLTLLVRTRTGLTAGELRRRLRGA